MGDNHPPGEDDWETNTESESESETNSSKDDVSDTDTATKIAVYQIVDSSVPHVTDVGRLCLAEPKPRPTHKTAVE